MDREDELAVGALDDLFTIDEGVIVGERTHALELKAAGGTTEHALEELAVHAGDGAAPIGALPERIDQAAVDDEKAADAAAVVAAPGGPKALQIGLDLRLQLRVVGLGECILHG